METEHLELLQDHSEMSSSDHSKTITNTEMIYVKYITTPYGPVLCTLVILIQLLTY